MEAIWIVDLQTLVGSLHVFKDATLIYLAYYFRHCQWMISLTFILIFLFRSFLLRPFWQTIILYIDLFI